ncbi:hypothetical protein F7C95_06175 [Opitutia bacterium ISCC 51]|nr:hypothetical protein F7C95_06175 [Opitutae bacterium ISCC 51]QXD29548.1 hypothetical protein GA003_06145 [Opitutae bacterium ISCC 52]
MSKLTHISTGRPEFDEFYPRIEAFLKEDTMDMVIDGVPVHGYRSPDCPAIWLRDHSDIIRGARHFEQDMTSAVTHFAETQAKNGRIFDFFTDQPLAAPTERENWVKYVRVPVEADVEYRYVKAAYLAWQTTGDDAWVQGLLPSLEAALNYVFTHPCRWDEKHQLVKRAYTIDSWDFAYTAGKHDWLQFQIDDNTFWGIMHGDNSGYYEACHLLARLFSRFDNRDKATHWQQFAEGLKDRMNKLCWNGEFYTHFVKITEMDIPGLDEASQLSFSNPMNINRGVTSLDQAQSILQEYQNRKSSTGSFAEWFSIHPGFPNGAFGEEKMVPGAYCNGGIMPLVGGELARAYLENGFEEIGVETLRQYYSMIKEKDETFLWYFPDGTASSIDNSTSPDAMPTDGWGSSSMLHGFMEGLVGIQDQGRMLDTVRLCPRWSAAGVTSAKCSMGYKASGAQFAYQYEETANGINLEIETAQSDVQLHLLLPERATVQDLKIQGKSEPFEQFLVGTSNYIRSQTTVDKTTRLKVTFT